EGPRRPAGGYRGRIDGVACDGTLPGGVRAKPDTGRDRTGPRLRDVRGVVGVDGQAVAVGAVRPSAAGEQRVRIRGLTAMPQTSANQTTSRASPFLRSLPFESGDHMDQKTFHALYLKAPAGVKAELIGGIVYVSSPTSFRHG